MAKDVKYRERKVVVKFGVGPPRFIRKQTGDYSFVSYHSGTTTYYSLISDLLALNDSFVACDHVDLARKGVNHN
jgi:hypothetical protein